MPFKSQAQRRLFYAKEARGELPKGTAAKWEEHTPKDKKLPEHVKKDKGMKKSAFFAGFDKRADQVAGAMGEPGQPLPAEGAAPGGAGGPPPAPEKLLKWNPQGGVDPRSPEEMAAAQAVDLITLPEEVEGSNCGNCKFFRNLDPGLGSGFCTHPEVKLDVTNRMKCSRWDQLGTYRPWEAVDPSAVPNSEIMGEAAGFENDMNAAAAGQPMPGAVSPEGAPPPAAEEGAPPAEKEPKKDKDSEKKSEPKKEGGGGTHTINVNVGSEKKAFWRGFGDV
jgi:hypothetical protein